MYLSDLHAHMTHLDVDCIALVVEDWLNHFFVHALPYSVPLSCVLCGSETAVDGIACIRLVHERGD